MEIATFGAGCFWGIEATYQKIKGVNKTEVGYLGGTLENPSYEDVCAGNTGHAEVVQVSFDPNEINFKQIIDIFWSNHNPTTLNQQGPDIGSQYRSAVFYHSDEQKQIAKTTKLELEQSARFKDLIVTEITKATTFYKAEEYHQQYLEKRGLSHCHI